MGMGMRARIGLLMAVASAGLLVIALPASATAAGITITPASLPNPTSGGQYYAELHAQVDPGVTPSPVLAWDITQGALPEGMYLSSHGAHGETGTIEGYPYLPGSSSFTVTAHDYSSVYSGSAAYSFTVEMPTDPDGLLNFVKMTPAYALRHSGCVGHVVTSVLSGRPWGPPGTLPCS
jgi:putative Ig domain-containing protein